MKARRLSLGMSMTIVLLIAVDFGLVKDAYRRADWPYPALLVTTLPMANALVLVAPGLRPGRPGRPSRIAFVAAGLLSIGLSVYLDLHHKESFLTPIRWLHRAIPYPLGTTAHGLITLAFTLVVYVPPQFVLACLAGWLANFPTKRRTLAPE